MVTNEAQARAATKPQLISALREADIPFKVKAPKAELVALLVESLKKKPQTKPSVALRLCQLFAKVGTKMTEDELKACFKDVAFDGTVRPWISSLKNPAYLPQGVTQTVVIKRKRVDGKTIFKRIG